MKTLSSIAAALVVLLPCSPPLLAATPAQDDAAQATYDGGWNNGSNGGSGLGAWVLSAAGSGGFFTASSSGNAGGSSGDIDTAGRSWGLWSTNGLTEATRPFAGQLATGQIFRVKIDNGWIESGHTVGFGLQNAAGDTLWEFYFPGGAAHYVIHNGTGHIPTRIPFTGNGIAVEFELTGSTQFFCRITATLSTNTTAWNFAGNLASQADTGISRFRAWSDAAGAGSSYDLFLNSMSIESGTISVADSALAYPVVDTGQSTCYNASTTITSPAPGAAFAGQDAQYSGRDFRFVASGDGLTVYDQVTRLTWQVTADIDGDGDIQANDKLTYAQAKSRPSTLNASGYGGFNDWRLPSIKELYSLIDFSGQDASGPITSTAGIAAFLNSNYFAFAYGDTNAGERLIDVQYASSNLYASSTNKLFGVNFADGRIKGYDLILQGSAKTFWVLCVRGNPQYGINDFADNGDGTVTDYATGLTWQKADSGKGYNWQSALAYAEGLGLGNYNDWRLPSAKELQSLLDYSRSPDSSGSAAISALFASSQITNEAGALDYPSYWSGTTHLKYTGAGDAAVYVCFGRGLGYDTIQSHWQDVHGAGCQRSDPKVGNPVNYPFGFGPQGDSVRISNYVRCVRGNALLPQTDSDGDRLTDWYEWQYSGSTTGMTASGDDDLDHYSNLDEQGAGTSPNDDTSYLAAETFSAADSGVVLTWPGIADRTYRITFSPDAATGQFNRVVAENIRATPPVNTYTDTVVSSASALGSFRIETE